MIIEDWAEDFRSLYDDLFEHAHGRWRPHVGRILDDLLECGDPRSGFARVKYASCNYELFVAVTCGHRGACPSCAMKRAYAFSDRLVEEILLPVPHRHMVFTLPKAVRPYFMYGRELMVELSRCAWQTINEMMLAAWDRNEQDAHQPGEALLRPCS